MVLKCNTGVLKADGVSHTIFDKTVDFIGIENVLDLSSLDSDKSPQNSASEEISNEHREDEEEHMNSSHCLVQPWHPKEYSLPGGGSLDHWDPWAQYCSIVSLTTTAQIHRRDPRSLEHKIHGVCPHPKQHWKCSALVSWLGNHNSLCKRTGILLEIARWHIQAEVREAHCQAGVR